MNVPGAARAAVAVAEAEAEAEPEPEDAVTLAASIQAAVAAVTTPAAVAEEEENEVNASTTPPAYAYDGVVVVAQEHSSAVVEAEAVDAPAAAHDAVLAPSADAVAVSAQAQEAVSVPAVASVVSVPVSVVAASRIAVAEPEPEQITVLTVPSLSAPSYSNVVAQHAQLQRQVDMHAVHPLVQAPSLQAQSLQSQAQSPARSQVQEQQERSHHAASSLVVAAAVTQSAAAAVADAAAAPLASAALVAAVEAAAAAELAATHAEAAALDATVLRPSAAVVATGTAAGDAQGLFHFPPGYVIDTRHISKPHTRPSLSGFSNNGNSEHVPEGDSSVAAAARARVRQLVDLLQAARVASVEEERAVAAQRKLSRHAAALSTRVLQVAVAMTPEQSVTDDNEVFRAAVRYYTVTNDTAAGATAAAAFATALQARSEVMLGRVLEARLARSHATAAFEAALAAVLVDAGVARPGAVAGKLGRACAKLGRLQSRPRVPVGPGGADAGDNDNNGHIATAADFSSSDSDSGRAVLSASSSNGAAAAAAHAGESDSDSDSDAESGSGSGRVADWFGLPSALRLAPGLPLGCLALPAPAANCRARQTALATLRGLLVALLAFDALTPEQLRGYLVQDPAAPRDPGAGIDSDSDSGADADAAANAAVNASSRGVVDDWDSPPRDTSDEPASPPPMYSADAHAKRKVPIYTASVSVPPAIAALPLPAPRGAHPFTSPAPAVTAGSAAGQGYPLQRAPLLPPALPSAAYHPGFGGTPAGGLWHPLRARPPLPAVTSATAAAAMALAPPAGGAAADGAATDAALSHALLRHTVAGFTFMVGGDVDAVAATETVATAPTRADAAAEQGRGVTGVLTAVAAEAGLETGPLTVSLRVDTAKPPTAVSARNNNDGDGERGGSVRVRIAFAVPAAAPAASVSAGAARVPTVVDAEPLPWRVRGPGAREKLDQLVASQPRGIMRPVTAIVATLGNLIISSSSDDDGQGDEIEPEDAASAEQRASAAYQRRCARQQRSALARGYYLSRAHTQVGTGSTPGARVPALVGGGGVSVAAANAAADAWAGSFFGPGASAALASNALTALWPTATGGHADVPSVADSAAASAYWLHRHRNAGARPSLLAPATAAVARWPWLPTAPTALRMRSNNASSAAAAAAATAAAAAEAEGLMSPNAGELGSGGGGGAAAYVPPPPPGGDNSSNAYGGDADPDAGALPPSYADAIHQFHANFPLAAAAGNSGNNGADYNVHNGADYEASEAGNAFAAPSYQSVVLAGADAGHSGGGARGGRRRRRRAGARVLPLRSSALSMVQAPLATTLAFPAQYLVDTPSIVVRALDKEATAAAQQARERRGECRQQRQWRRRERALAVAFAGANDAAASSSSSSDSDADVGYRRDNEEEDGPSAPSAAAAARAADLLPPQQLQAVMAALGAPTLTLPATTAPGAPRAAAAAAALTGGGVLALRAGVRRWAALVAALLLRCGGLRDHRFVLAAALRRGAGAGEWLNPVSFPLANAVAAAEEAAASGMIGGGVEANRAVDAAFVSVSVIDLGAPLPASFWRFSPLLRRHLLLSLATILTPGAAFKPPVSSDATAASPVGALLSVAPTTLSAAARAAGGDGESGSDSEWEAVDASYIPSLLPSSLSPSNAPSPVNATAGGGAGPSESELCALLACVPVSAFVRASVIDLDELRPLPLPANAARAAAAAVAALALDAAAPASALLSGAGAGGSASASVSMAVNVANPPSDAALFASAAPQGGQPQQQAGGPRGLSALLAASLVFTSHTHPLPTPRACRRLRARALATTHALTELLCRTFRRHGDWPDAVRLAAKLISDAAWAAAHSALLFDGVARESRRRAALRARAEAAGQHICRCERPLVGPRAGEAVVFSSTTAAAARAGALGVAVTADLAAGLTALEAAVDSAVASATGGAHAPVANACAGCCGAVFGVRWDTDAAGPNGVSSAARAGAANGSMSDGDDDSESDDDADGADNAPGAAPAAGLGWAYQRSQMEQAPPVANAAPGHVAAPPRLSRASQRGLTALVTSLLLRMCAIVDDSAALLLLATALPLAALSAHARTRALGLLIAGEEKDPALAQANNSQHRGAAATSGSVPSATQRLIALHTHPRVTPLAMWALRAAAGSTVALDASGTVTFPRAPQLPPLVRLLQLLERQPVLAPHFLSTVTAVATSGIVSAPSRDKNANGAGAARGGNNADDGSRPSALVRRCCGIVGAETWTEKVVAAAAPLPAGTDRHAVWGGLLGDAGAVFDNEREAVMTVLTSPLAHALLPLVLTLTPGAGVNEPAGAHVARPAMASAAALALARDPLGVAPVTALAWTLFMVAYVPEIAPGVSVSADARASALSVVPGLLERLCGSLPSLISLLLLLTHSHLCSDNAADLVSLFEALPYERWRPCLTDLRVLEALLLAGAASASSSFVSSAYQAISTATAAAGHKALAVAMSSAPAGNGKYADMTADAAAASSFDALASTQLCPATSQCFSAASNTAGGRASVSSSAHPLPSPPGSVASAAASTIAQLVVLSLPLGSTAARAPQLGHALTLTLTDSLLRVRALMVLHRSYPLPGPDAEEAAADAEASSEA